MLIERLVLKNFLSHKETELDFSDTYLSVLVGNNGAGKSSVMDAINYALFGVSRNGSGVREIDRLIHYSEPWMQVELEWISDNRRYRVIRYRERDRSTKLELYIDEELKEGRVQEIQESISRCVGTNSDVWSTTVHASQDRNSLLLASPTERKKVLFDLLQLQQYKQYEDQVKLHRQELKVKTDVLQRQYNQFSVALSAIQIDEERSKLTLVTSKLKELKQAKSKYEGKLAATVAQYSELKSKLNQVQSKRLELANLTADYDLIVRRIDRLQAKTAGKSELESRIAVGTQQLEKIKLVQAKVVAEINRLTELDIKCRERKVTFDAEFQSIRTETQSNIAKLNKIQTEIDNNCSQCGQEITEQHKQGHVQELQQTIGLLQTKLEEIKVKQSKINAKYSEIIDSLAKSNTQKEHCQHKTSVISTDISTAKTQLASIQHDEEELVSAELQLSKMKPRLIALQSEIDQHKNNLELFKAADQQKSEYSNQIEQVNVNIESGITLKSRLETKIKEYETNIDQFQSLKTEIDELLRQDLLAAELLKAVSQSGIPFKIIEQTLPIIEQTVNSKLQDLNSNLKLKFATSKQLKSSGKSIDTLDILIENSLGELVAAEMCSGGERLRLDLSLRIALAEYLALYNNISSLKTIFLDEYFSALDEDGQQRVMSVLDEMGSKLGIKVIFITHLKEVQEYGTSLFFFEKVEGISKVFKKHE